jgi:hypothetical protein
LNGTAGNFIARNREIAEGQIARGKHEASEKVGKGSK